MKRILLFVIAWPIAMLFPASADIVGHWTFEPGNELNDLTGNFPDLLLRGDAEVKDGKLDVNGSGTNASGWAVTDSDGGEYGGPLVEDKTLVSWVTLESLENVAKEGSVITIDRISSDHFDGIIFAERQANRWMNGSSGFDRTQNWDPGFEETRTDELIMMAITYEVSEEFGDLKIIGYRNGVEIGQYETGNASSWDAGDAEIFFGKRHGGTNRGPGALDALIEEASIYNVALTAEQIGELYAKSFSIAKDDDGDGLSDDWEREHFADLAQAADGDPDGDGVSNRNEFLRQLDPNKDDTDGDGYSDGAETGTGVFVSLEDTGSDPRSDDTDADGLKDGVENPLLAYNPDNPREQPGTDPNNDNTDEDRVPDGMEIENGTDPTNPLDPPPPTPSELLIGQWTFEPGEELIDLTGNFPELVLKDDGMAAEVTVVDGRGVLDVNGSGTNATGWAVTDSQTGEYVGPPIENKTLVAWVTLESLENVAKAGSVITIDRISSDHFDGIIFAELETNRWMAGSSHYRRTQNWTPGFEETEVGEYVMMAISYEHLDNGIEVTGYRNGEEIGSYVAGVQSSWEPGDAEIFFGERHGTFDAGGPGALDALIDEARLYGDVLTAAQIEQLYLDGPGGGERFAITEVALETEGMLSLTWESQPGQLFAIEESFTLTEPWTVMATNIPAADAPDLLTSAGVEIDAEQRSAFYRVVRVPPPPLFLADFEDGMGEWTVGVIEGFEATQTSWEIGEPSSGPGAAFDGVRAAGTDLDADYVDATGIFLRSPVVDLTGVARPKLEFTYYLEAGEGEGGRLNLLEADGTLIETIGIFDGGTQGVTQWTQHTIRLPEVNRPIIVEFELLSAMDDPADNGAGWYIDHVVVDR